MVSGTLQEAGPQYENKPLTFWKSLGGPLGGLQAAAGLSHVSKPLIPGFDKVITVTELVRQQGTDQADQAQLTRLGEDVFTEEYWMSWRDRYLNMLTSNIVFN